MSMSFPVLPIEEIGKALEPEQEFLSWPANDRLDKAQFWGLPEIFTYDEAVALGVPLTPDQSDWLTKFTPNQAFEGGFEISLLTPDQDELRWDGSVLTAEGTLYTREELEVQQEQAQLLLRQQLEEQYQALPEEYRAWLENPYRAAVDITVRQNIADTLGKVVPDYMIEGWAPQDVEANLLEWLAVDPEQFFRWAQVKGRSPDTEKLLRLLIPDIGLEEIHQVFYGHISPQLKTAWTEVFGPNDADERITQVLDTPGVLLKTLNQIGWSHENEYLARLMFPEKGDLEIREIFPKADYEWHIGDLWNSVEAGVGDFIASLGGAAKWLGVEGIGQTWLEFGGFLQDLAPPDTLGAFNWKHLYNPKFYGTTVLRTGAFTMSLIPAAILGGSAGAAAGGRIAMALKLGSFATKVVTQVSRYGIAALSARSLESALEAGAAYDQALDMGMSREEADAVASGVFKGNMVLAGWDAAQFALMFAPINPTIVKNAVARGLLRTAVNPAGKIVLLGLSEGGEEIYQEIVTRHYLGLEIKWDSEMQLVATLGGMMGVAMAGGAIAYTTIRGRVIDKLSTQQRQQFDAEFSKLRQEGVEGVQAEEQALDTLMETENLDQIVEDVVEKVNKEELLNEITVKSEAERVAWEESFRTQFPEADLQTAAGLELGTGALDARISDIESLLAIPGRLPAGYGTKIQLRLEYARLEADREFHQAMRKSETLEDLNYYLSRYIEMIRVEQYNRSAAYHARAPNLFTEFDGAQLAEMLNRLENFSGDIEVGDVVMPEVVGEVPAVVPEPAVPAVEPHIPNSEVMEVYQRIMQSFPSQIRDDIHVAEIRIGKFAAEHEGEGGRVNIDRLVTGEDRISIALEQGEPIEPNLRHELLHVYVLAHPELPGAKATLEGREPFGMERAIREVEADLAAGRLPEVTEPAVEPAAPPTAPTPEAEAVEEGVARRRWQIITGLRGGKMIKLEPTPAITAIVAKFTEAIKAWVPIRAETEQLKSRELARRVAVAESILKRYEGAEAFVRSRAALAGELVDEEKAIAEYEVSKEEYILTPDEIVELHNYIRDAEMPFFQRFNTETALLKVLHGRLPTEGELMLLEAMFGAEFAQAIFNANRTFGQKATELFMDVWNFPKALRASFDMSAPLRQGAPLAVGQREEFVAAGRLMLQGWLNEARAEQIQAELFAGRLAPKWQKAGLDVTRWAGVGVKLQQREESYMTRGAHLIPGIRMSERAYVIFLNVLRVKTFESYVEQWEVDGIEITDKRLRRLARFINWGTGRGDLGALQKIAVYLNLPFFAPKFVASRFEFFILPFIETDPVVRKIVAKNWASAFSTGMGILSLLAFAGASVERDPRSSDWGKARFGNIRIDIWGGFQQPARFIAQLITAERKTSAGRIIDANRLDLVTRFGRSKLSPSAGLVWDILEGQGFIGEDPLEAGVMFERMTPFFIQDMMEAIDEAGLIGGLMAMPSWLGVGVLVYPDRLQVMVSQLGTTIETEEGPEVYGVKALWTDISRMTQGMTPEEIRGGEPYTDMVRAIVEGQNIQKALDERVEGVDPDDRSKARNDWLRDNPSENAKLAVWGKAKPLTQEAYDGMLEIANRLGIDESLLDVFVPRDVAPSYFDYQRLVDEKGSASSEAILLRADNPQLQAWGEENLDWKPIDRDVRVARINVEYAEEDEAYEAKVAGQPRTDYLQNNPEYATARRKRDAYTEGFADALINNYVAYYDLPDKGYWRERYLLDNPDFHKAMIDLKDIQPFEADYRAPDVKYDELYIRYQDLFDAYEGATGTADERKTTRTRIFELNPEFRTAYYRRKAYGLFVPEQLVDKFVDYYKLPLKGDVRDEFLRANRDYHDAVWVGILENDPIPEVEVKPRTILEIMEEQGLLEEWAK